MAVDVFEAARFESLWERFESVIAAPLRNPLAIETVVVPGRGWSNWFARRLAVRLGCWSGFECLSAGQWMSETLESLLGPELAPRRESDALTWFVASELPGLLDDDDFAPVRGYLYRDGAGQDVQRLIDLSRNIGGLFDRYLLFRPELIAAWQQSLDWPYADPDRGGRATERPPEATWQRKLWQRVEAASGFRPVSAMIEDLALRLEQLDNATRAELLPERLSIWLTGGVAPALLSLIEVIGRYVDVSLFALAPATHFWSDMQGRRDLLRRLRDSHQSLHEFCRQNHVYLLHPLLASMAEPARQQQMLMVDCDAEPWQWQEIDESMADVAEAETFSLPGCGVRTSAPSSHKTTAANKTGKRKSKQKAASPQMLLFSEDDDEDELASLERATAPRSLLDWLQRGIRAAREPKPQSLPRDSSVRIHNCHSAVREAEVLHNAIREALEDSLTLAPEDVIVLCPALDDYASLIAAVFGSSNRSSERQIPYLILGLSPRRERPFVDAWLRLIAALQSRFEASLVLDLLACEPIRRRAGFDEADVERIADWIADAAIHWGLDAGHRVAEGQPESDLNTWQFGLDRLLLGYAMPPGGGQLVGNTVALDRVEGLAGTTLGRLATLLDRLADWKRRLETSRTLRDWQTLLGRMTDAFLDAESDEAGLQQILDALNTVSFLAGAAGFENEVAASVVAREVERLVDAPPGSSGFRAGGVTFCSLDAVRCLPHRVVALLGMNEATFPRRDRALGFDLMARQRQIGDVSPRDNDRQLFLDALLAAGERFIVTYQGQDVRGKSQRSPSIVVEELLDLLDRCDASTEASTTGATVERATAGLPGSVSSSDTGTAGQAGSGTPLRVDSSRQRSLRESICVRHPLQSFSPSYFDGGDPRLVSFDERSLDAARRLAGEPAAPPRFADRPLEFEDDGREIRIDELEKLITEPWRLFLASAGIGSLEIESDVEDRASLLLDGLDRWQLGDEWLDRLLLDELPEEVIQRVLQRGGSVPDSGLGSVLLGQIGSEAGGIIAQMRDLDFVPGRERLEVDLDLGRFRITGRVDYWSAAGLRQVTFSSLNARQELKLWLHQLLVSATGNSPSPPAVMLGRGQSRIAFRGVEPEAARAQLTRLAELAEIARRSPLFFLASDASIEPVRKNKVQFDDEASVRKFLSDARGYFEEARGHATPPCEAPDVRAAFAGVDPLELTCANVPGLDGFGDENLFVRMVREISVPLLDAAGEVPQ
ncbi:exodeoxyribonuclease V subunit gamma [bacterium]|nr:exodeoxyribonuclease V subunit gamma [bacterium]